MVILKENEIQVKQDIVTLKTSKGKISKWIHDINEWFISLDYKVNDKILSGSQQLSYECDNQKFTFVYYTTGRITIKSNDNDIDKL